MMSPDTWLHLRMSPCSGVRAVLMFPFKPRAAVLRAATLPLMRTYRSHLAVMFIFYVCAFLFSVYVHTYPWPVTAKMHRAGRIGFGQAASQLLDQTGLGTLFVIPLAVEIAFLAAAFLFLAWAAQPESIGQTVRRTLRTLWLSSTVWVFAVMLPVAAWQWNELLRRQTAIPWPNTNTGRVILKPDSPWILHERNAQALIVLFSVSAILWMAWCFVRALRTPTALSCPVLPPTCQSCGYNLSHIPESGRCPECGTSTTPSLASDPPVSDAGRTNFQLLLSDLRFSRFAGLAPKRIFATLRILSGQDRAQRFALFWAGMLSMVVLLAPVVVQQRVDPPTTGQAYGPWLLGLDLIPFAMAGFLMLLMGISAVASALGIWQSLLDGRNQLSAAAKAAFYNADFVAVWAAVALGVYFFRDFPYLQIYSPSVFRMAQVIEANRPWSDRLGQIAFLIIGLGWFLWLTRRAMREMRFAYR